MSNNIDTEITDSDTFNGRGKSAQTLAREILSHLKNACPYGTTFMHDIPNDKRSAVEAELKARFENWANSWIAPRCREILTK